MTWLLRYLFALASSGLGSVMEQLNQMIPMEKMPHLMIIYGMGFVCIWLCLYYMYKHALSNSEELELNSIELYETRFSRTEKLQLAMVGGFSVLLSVISIILKFPLGAALAGWAYNLIWVMVIIRVRKRNKQLQLLLENHS
jgi:hypothetical protein